MKRKHVLTHIAILIAVIVAAVLGGCYTMPTMPEEVDYSLHVKLADFEDKVLTVDMSPDGLFLAAGSMDNTVKMYNLYSGELVREFKRHPDDIFTLSFGPKGKYLATGCRDRMVRIFEVATGELIYTFDRHNDTIYDIEFHPDGRFVVSSGKDNAIYVWDLIEGELFEIIRFHTDSVYAIDFTSDGEILVSGGLDKQVGVWSSEEVSRVGEFKVKQDIYSVAISPDDSLVALSGPTRTRGGNPGQKTSPIQVHSLSGEYKRAEVFTGHQPDCWSLAFTPSGKYLISGGTDERIRIWSMEPSLQKLVGSFDSNAGAVWSIALSPDGNFLAAACSDNAVMVYRR